jgi:hypothetical protein
MADTTHSRSQVIIPKTTTPQNGCSYKLSPKTLGTPRFESQLPSRLCPQKCAIFRGPGGQFSLHPIPGPVSVNDAASGHGRAIATDLLVLQLPLNYAEKTGYSARRSRVHLFPQLPAARFPL